MKIARSTAFLLAAALLALAPGSASALSLHDATGRVPAVAHASGAAGSQFRTDAWFHNPNPYEVYVDLYLDYRISGVPATAEHFAADPGGVRVPPNGQVEVGDLVLTLFGLSSAAGSLFFDAYNPVNDNEAPVYVFTRTYNTAASPATFGQGIPGIPVLDAVDRTGNAQVIPGLSNANGFRSNVGFAETDGSPIFAQVKLFSSTGVQIGNTVEILLSDYNWYQRDIFEWVGAPAGIINARAEVRAISRSAEQNGAIIAYGSLIDGRVPAGHSVALNDPTYIIASEQYTAAATGTVAAKVQRQRPASRRSKR